MLKTHLLENLIICPYCNFPLSFRYFNKRGLVENRSAFGIAKCSCDEFPIVEGIVYLQKNDQLLNRQIVVLLKKRKFDEAVWLGLTSSARTHKWVVFSFYLLKKYFGIKPSFTFLVTTLKTMGPAKSWFEYILGRTKRDDIQLAYQVCKKRVAQGVFVDLGFGLGNFFLMFPQKLRNKIEKYIAIEKSFLSLFISTMHLKNPPFMVCADFESHIPLKNSRIDTLLVLDTLSYVYAKDAFLKECQRLLKRKGVLFIGNLYETTQKTYFWGYGIAKEIFVKIAKKYFAGCKLSNNETKLTRNVPNIALSKINKEGYSCVLTKK